MKATEFCYWLQGLYELGNPQQLDPIQTELIRRHLRLVFIHDIDPSYPEHQQDQLNAAHSGKEKNPNVVDPSVPVHGVQGQTGGKVENQSLHNMQRPGDTHMRC